MDAIDCIKYKKVGRFEETRFEKVYNAVFEDSSEGSKVVAQEIATLIQEKQTKKEHCILGLATGSSPIKVYDELVRMHREDGLSFENVITFNLDEYYPIKRSDLRSYHYFMHQYLFDHVNIPKENINIPSGEIDSKSLQQYCLDYDLKIKALGGLDFQLLGIGRTGHIGFNEPVSHINSGTRIIRLDSLTRYDATLDFNSLEKVPHTAITMGIGTILKSKRIVLLGWGHKKAEIIKSTIEDEITPKIPASYLQNHDNTTFVLDKESASALTRHKTPWITSQCIWNEKMIRRAVFWLARTLNKPILKLTDRNYNDYGMSSLLAQKSSAYTLNIAMFNVLQHTITGWPGGKPNVDDTNRPERSTPSKKRIIIFSPHPDDDVISMGGTFDRLVDQGHEVHVAYQTSGNIAVDDREAMKFCEVAVDMNPNTKAFYGSMIKSLNTKEDNSVDSLEVRRLKGMIRKRESYAAIRYVGLPDGNVHFMNLPFYETGTVKKNPIGKKDIDMIVSLIDNIKPHQIYAAGDLADPHGTHEVCLNGIFSALEILKQKPYMKDCYIWLYRGAWHEWDIHDIEMAVPMSPEQVIKKRNAIFFHQSQKDSVMFQGDDSREFWMRVEDRNRATAKLYNALGMAEYEAIEAFHRYHFL